MSTAQTAWNFENPWYNNTVGVCVNGTYTGWRDMFYCVDPGFWAFLGLVMSLGLSIVGAAW